MSLIEKAKQSARELHRKFGSTVPINVEKLASLLGVRVVALDLDKTTSGFIIEKDGEAIIGVNKDHHPNRQRFTIAHELGHFRLHQSISKEFFDSYTVSFRNQRSSTGTNPQEIQANAFAAELLLPEDEIVSYLDASPFDALDDLEIYRMAEHFGVSVQSLSIRLASLGLVTTNGG